MFEGTDNLNHTSAVRCVLDAYGPTRFDVMDAQTQEERAGAAVPGRDHQPGAGTREPAVLLPAGARRRRTRVRFLTTIRHHPSRGWSALRFRAFQTGCVPPVR